MTEGGVSEKLDRVRKAMLEPDGFLRLMPDPQSSPELFVRELKLRDDALLKSRDDELETVRGLLEDVLSEPFRDDADTAVTMKARAYLDATRAPAGRME